MKRLLLDKIIYFMHYFWITWTIAQLPNLQQFLKSELLVYLAISL